MLRAYGHFIINLMELRKYANLWQIYNQLDQFIEFAEIHCVPLSLFLDNGCLVEYLNKEFWQDILKDNKSLQKYYNKRNLTVQDCLQDIIDRRVLLYEREKRREQFVEAGISIPVDWNVSWEKNIERAVEDFLEGYKNLSDKEKEEMEREIKEKLKDPFVADEDFKNSLKQEITQLHIREKLSVLLEEVKTKKENPSIAIILVSICMLAEMDPTTENIFSDMPEESLSPFKEHAETVMKEKTQVIEQLKSKTEAKKDNGINKISSKTLCEETEKLKCQRQPYRWYLYESDSLQANEIIKTIKLEAVKSNDAFDSTCIQIYSEKKQKVVWEFFLKPGEYRHCNVAGGKIICFLPTLSISDNLCIYRPYYYSGDLIVQYKEGRKSVQLEYGADISSFSAGKDGEIYLRKGCVLTGRYLLSKKNYKIESKLDMLSYESFVEVKVIDGGFLLLNNRGKIRSNLSEWDGRNAVSLYERTWLNQMSGKNKYKIRELCLDESKKNIVMHLANNEGCKIQWFGKL